MSLRPDDAAASLSEIAAVERRTRETIGYARSSAALILWGVLLVIGYAGTEFAPAYARTGWLALICAGFAGTLAISYRRARGRPAGHSTGSRWDRPLLLAMFILYGYGWIFVTMLWPLTARQLAAFWPNLFMLGFVIAGLWLGPFFILLGLSVSALTVLGYFWSGAWFQLWMAAAGGGGLIVGGLWLRRLGGSG
jgi:hypothetical protein